MAYPRPSGYAGAGVAYKKPKPPFFTYAKGGAGRDPREVLKLAKGQVLRFAKGQGYYAGKGGVPSPARARTASGAGARSMQDFTVEQFAEMLNKKQKGSLDALLAESATRARNENSAMAGFGAALQGYSNDLWNQTNEAYRNAAAAQQSAAQGLGGQVGQGIAEARAQQAALAGQLGYTGDTTLPTPEQAAAQVASEGGAETGKMMGQVGTAWGGYGATRPEYIGFMTGQNQMQVLREQAEGDRELKAKFLELGMDNPKTALDMWTAMQANRRENVSTSMAQQTLRTNISMQRAKLKQAYAEMRIRAKTNAQKLALDRQEFEQERLLDQQELAIDQQTANARTTTAAAAARRAATAEWKALHPAPPKPPKPPRFGGTSTYQQKVATAMSDVPDLFDESAGSPEKKTDYAFGVLWGQMAPFVSAANQPAAKALLRQRILNAAKKYQRKPSSSGAGAGGW